VDVLMMLVMHVRVRMIHQFMPMDMVANFSPMQPDTVQLHALALKVGASRAALRLKQIFAPRRTLLV
jgi:hypothetical protein